MGCAFGIDGSFTFLKGHVNEGHLSPSDRKSNNIDHMISCVLQFLSGTDGAEQVATWSDQARANGRGTEYRPLVMRLVGSELEEGSDTLPVREKQCRLAAPPKTHNPAVTKLTAAPSWLPDPPETQNTKTQKCKCQLCKSSVESGEAELQEILQSEAILHPCKLAEGVELSLHAKMDESSGDIVIVAIAKAVPGPTSIAAAESPTATTPGITPPMSPHRRSPTSTEKTEGASLVHSLTALPPKLDVSAMSIETLEELKKQIDDELDEKKATQLLETSLSTVKSKRRAHEEELASIETEIQNLQAKSDALKKQDSALEKEEAQIEAQIKVQILSRKRKHSEVSQ